MKRFLFVLPIVLALALFGAGAWAVDAIEDFESAAIGDINGQNSGTGWAAAWVSKTDTRQKAEVYDNGDNQVLLMRGTGASSDVSRQFNSSLWEVNQLWLSFEMEMLGTPTQPYSIALRNGTTQCVQAKVYTNGAFQWQDGAGLPVLTTWDGSNTEFIWGVDLVTDTADVYVRKPATGAYSQIGNGLALKTPTDQLDNFRLWDLKIGSIDDYTGWVALDNIQVSTRNPIPEPGSILALTTGLVGLAGVVVRRRR